MRLDCLGKLRNERRLRLIVGAHKIVESLKALFDADKWVMPVWVIGIITHRDVLDPFEVLNIVHGVGIRGNVVRYTRVDIQGLFAGV